MYNEVYRYGRVDKYNTKFYTTCYSKYIMDYFSTTYLRIYISKYTIYSEYII